MAIFGFTAEGLKIKRLADIQEEMQSDARVTFGSSVDLDARRPLGQFIGIQAEQLSQVWELVEQLHLAQSPRTAAGKQLDEVVVFNGLIRRPATFSKVGVVVTGDEGDIIEAGSRASVSGAPESIFAIDTDIAITAGVNAVQKLTFLSIPSDGSFTLTLDGQVSDPIQWDALAIDIEVAIEAMSNIQSVSVTGNMTSGVFITFTFADGQRPWNLMQVGSNTLTSRTVHRVTVNAGGAAVDDKGFRFADADGNVGVWFDTDASGVAMPAGLDAITARDIRVDSVVSGDTAAQVATKLAAELAADPAIFEAHVITSTTVEFTLMDEAPLQALVDFNTTFTLATPNIGRDIGGLIITPSTTTPGQWPSGAGTATAITAGAISAPAGSLTVIEDTQDGWDSITNPLDAEAGNEKESDAELKARRIEQFAKAGRAVPNAIKSKLLDVEGVTSARVRFNNESITVDGIPPKSVRAYVLGGDEDDIAATLFDSVAAGISTDGSESVVYIDDDGFNHTIKFQRPTIVDIYVVITIKKNAADTWPSTATADLQQAVIDYGATLQMGDDVIPYPRLMAHLDILERYIQDMDLKIGTAPAPVSDDRIEIESEELADFDTSRISVIIEDL